MPKVRGSDNHPQCGKLRTNFLLLHEQDICASAHISCKRTLTTLSYRELLCIVLSLLFILIFSGSSASVCTRVWKPYLLQCEMVPVSCWVSRSTEQMFWWVSESVLRRSKGSSSSSVSDKEEVRNCSEGWSSIDQPPAFPITLPVRWILTSCS